MKLLQVNCVYNKGSTGKIMQDIHNQVLNMGWESIICYGRGEKTTDKYVYKTCSEIYSKFNNLLSRFTGIMYGGCFFSTNKLISIIKKENPDIVHLHCINGYFVNIYRLIKWLNKSRIKTVLTLHAEFMHTANCGHAYECEKWKTGCGKCPRLKKATKSIFIDNTHLSWKRMKKAFEDFENLTVVSVSGWLRKRAELSPILKEKDHTVVLNGLNTDIFKPYETDDLKKELNLGNKKILFHVTASFNSEVKGGQYIIELARRLEKDNIAIIVAGNYNKEKTYPESIIFLGNISDQTKLAKLYSMADLTVLASKKETFSMPVAESLCCGTTVVGFKAGGPEEITINEYSEFVDYGDIDKLEKAVREFLDKQFDLKEICEKAIEKYSKETMAKGYIDIYVR